MRLRLRPAARVLVGLALAAPMLGIAAPALAARVEVTRFHTPETLTRLAPGAVAVAVAPAPGTDSGSLETRLWLDAVGRALASRGFRGPDAGQPPRVAEVRVTRDLTERREGRGAGPSVGVGVGTGWGGGWRGGSHVGVGVGFGGGSGSARQVETELAVVIRDAATRAPLWEGRAVSRTRPGSREDDPARLAERLAGALFTGFPGRSGETIEVR